MTNNMKDIIQYGSALGMMLSGVVLVFLDFFLHSTIQDNTLIYVGQCLVYAGSIFGVSIYFITKGKNFVREAIDEISKKFDFHSTSSSTSFTKENSNTDSNTEEL